MKIGTLVVESHSEGKMSQNLYLDHSFLFIKSKKLCCKKW